MYALQTPLTENNTHYRKKFFCPEILEFENMALTAQIHFY